jgi:SAM-dependent MidA family methyltransferase
VELSAALARRQRDLLEAEGLASKVSWTEALPNEIEGCLLSNELLDSMPVHRVAVEGGRLLEVFVTWDGSRFVEELRVPSSDKLAGYFARLQLLPGEGCHAEVNLAALRWIREAAEAVRRGVVLTFDYGYEAAELYAPWRRDGTLLCFYRHNPSDDPYIRIGRQDMTSHIDFTSLRRGGDEVGLTTLGMVSQNAFLTNLGINDALSPPGEGGTDLEGYYSRRRAVMELLDPAGLGRMKVLMQGRGVGNVKLGGIGEGA